MAEEAGAKPRDEEETQNNSDEDPFPSCDAETAFPDCSASPPLASLGEDKGSSVGPERLSVLSSKVMAQAKALAGPEINSGSQAQSRASGLAEYRLISVGASGGGSSFPTAVYRPKPVGLASVCSESLCCICDQDSEASHLPGVTEGGSESTGAVVALSVNNSGCCHMLGASAQPWGSSAEGGPCSPGPAIWMKTTEVMDTLENKKKEEKEKYRLQIAMYRRLLLLRSIRSLHKQLEQQQARLQECYGMVINTKKEMLKHIHSAVPSPSP